MKKRMQMLAALSVVVVAFALAGCDGDGGDVVIVDDGIGYDPATIENNSFDDVLIDSDMFGQIYLPPGSGVDLDVGPNIDRVLVFVNGSFFEEIYIGSGDVVVFD